MHTTLLNTSSDKMLIFTSRDATNNSTSNKLDLTHPATGQLPVGMPYAVGQGPELQQQYWWESLLLKNLPNSGAFSFL